MRQTQFSIENMIPSNNIHIDVFEILYHVENLHSNKLLPMHAFVAEFH